MLTANRGSVKQKTAMSAVQPPDMGRTKLCHAPEDVLGNTG